MANFEVSTRVDYRDVSNLIVDCSAGDMELDTTGRIQTWFNRAQQDPITGGRFLNLTQLTDANKPVINQITKAARFSGGQYLTAPLIGSLGAAKEDWSVAIDIVPAGTLTTPEAVLASQDDSFRVWRQTGANWGYQTPFGLISQAGDMLPGQNFYRSDGLGSSEWLVANSGVLSGTVSAWGFPADTDDALYIGASVALNDFLNADFYSIRVWSRTLSPKELDLVHQTIGRTDTSAGVLSTPRATVQLDTWADDTFDQTLRQVNRLNPQIGITHKYVKATIPAGEVSAIVQFACLVEAEVRPDTQLAGQLFNVSFSEMPGTSPPPVYKDLGWSAVFDVSLTLEGHYTMSFDRPQGGAVFVHLDVERETPL